MKASGGVEVELHASAALPTCALGHIAGLNALDEKFVAPFGASVTVPPVSAAWSMLTTLKISVMLFCIGILCEAVSIINYSH